MYDFGPGYENFQFCDSERLFKTQSLIKIFFAALPMLIWRPWGKWLEYSSRKEKDDSHV